MMTEIAASQARALAALVAALRPDWDTAGILTKLSEARDRGTAYDLAHAALYAAEDPTNRTPAVITLTGPHWTRGRPLGQTTATTPADMPGRNRCTKPGHEHERAHNCRICISDAKAIDDREAAARNTLRTQHVPGDAIRRIRAAINAPTTPDARTRATGDPR